MLTEIGTVKISVDTEVNAMQIEASSGFTITIPLNGDRKPVFNTNDQLNQVVTELLRIRFWEQQESKYPDFPPDGYCTNNEAAGEEAETAKRTGTHY